MDLGLADQVVLVTGASGGIGRALAQTFVDEGARVVLAGHARLAELREHVAEQGWGERALAVAADVRQPAALAAAFEQAVARFGRVDACIANAGAWTTP